tara:strand:- start:2050 stop:4683 length:2634 start_codon:yes stop_codon:yes gene_type:complete
MARTTVGRGREDGNGNGGGGGGSTYTPPTTTYTPPTTTTPPFDPQSELFVNDPIEIGPIDFGDFDFGIDLGLDFNIADDIPIETWEAIDFEAIPTNEEINQTVSQMTTLKPLPSIPSISNVGSVPFTGTVSSIPGGFQPLPQVAGNRKKLYQLSKFHGGINQRSSPRDISDMECVEAENVTVSSIGRIKLLGDCLNEDNTLKEFAAISGAGYAPTPGYGLFEFTAPADWDGGNTGSYKILLTSDGDQIDALDHDGGHAGWMDFAGSGDSDTDVAPVFYAAGNGVYVCDANFGNTANDRQAKIYVHREDTTGAVKGWKAGLPLIISPHQENTAAGEVDSVTLVDASSSDSLADAAGETIINVKPSGTGEWDGTYTFYVSYVFDGGVETGLTSIGTDVFDEDTLTLNPSISHQESSGGTGHIGNNSRIEGGRIYFKHSDGNERFLLAEFSMKDGVMGALDSTFVPWTISGDIHDLADGDRLVFDAPPEVHTYLSKNGYYANEVYAISSDTPPDADGVGALDVRYKTAVVGSNGIVFIGNVKRDGRHMPDLMMFSMPNKPGVFPLYNRFDSPSSDGSPIMALAAFRDTILQFKQNGMYVVNVSNPGPDTIYAQASFRDCGVSNPCQVFTTSFGVIFVNRNGCFIYDGQKVTSLTAGKFDASIHFDIGESSAVDIGDSAYVPCIGYDPRSQSIVILKNITDNGNVQNGWVYNMQTQSWTEGIDMITNAGAADRHTNFIITSTDGLLSIKHNDDPTLLNYNQGQASGNAQAINYTTKDLDFGLPSQTKKIFKIYVTYLGNGSGVTVQGGIDGDTTPTQALTNAENSGATLTNAGTTDHNVATFTIDNPTADLKSFMLKFSGSAAEDFEINDISILYRARPIK